MAQADSNNTTPAPVDPTRRRFMSHAASVAAGSAVLAVGATIPAPVIAATAGPLDVSKASPALRDAIADLNGAHDSLRAANARYAADESKVEDWEANNPRPTNGRARKRWARKSREYNDATAGESWEAKREAQKRFRKALHAVAKVKPRDSNDIGLKACAAAVYDPIESGYGPPVAIISYSVTWDLLAGRLPCA